MKVCLHQFLSKTGEFDSKKAVFQAIKNSEIKVGGNVILDPEHRFDRRSKNVYWKGKLLKPIGKKVYVLLNKPEGYLSSQLTKKDVELGKKSVFDLLGNDIDTKVKKTLFCVGRLDEDSSGLLIITNDGALGTKIASPENNIEKTYEVVLEKPISKDDGALIEKGVVIDLEENGKIAKYKTKKCKITISGNKLNVSLTEGKKREVKRMFEAVGNKVFKLKRISIGALRLEDLHGESCGFVNKIFLESKLSPKSSV